MSVIIFDFDGTIADSFDYVFDFLAVGTVAANYDAGQRQSFRGLSMATLARGLGHRWWRLPNLFLKGRRQMQGAIKHVKPFDGMTEVIQKLHAEGHELFIVSSNNVRNIHDFLHTHDLHTYFLEIYGSVGLFGKAPTLRKLMKQQNFEVKDCTFIGDELRDVEAAKSLKMPIIAVSWGFAKRADLKKIHPTVLVDTPAGLLERLQSL